ncbi:MAG: DNA repair protein RadC [Pseudomonadota bacterium]
MKFHVFEVKEPKFPVSFSSAKDVFDTMSGFSKSDREMFMILFLNTKNKMIDYVTHTIGTVDSSSVYPRDVLKSALYFNAAALIFCHNHPSGDPEPSTNDKMITKTMVMICELAGIPVLDHVILGKDVFYSFADAGLIDDYKRQGQQILNRL